MDIEKAVDGNQLIDENPDILKKVEPNTKLKKWLVNYVGKQHTPKNDEVTIDMVLKTMAAEFPEFLLPIAEENFVRGYKQALDDVEEGKKLMKLDSFYHTTDVEEEKKLIEESLNNQEKSHNE